MGRELASDWQTGIASALDWWREAGVDTLVEDAPRDWLARTAPPKSPAAAEAAADAVAAAPAEVLPDTLDAFVAWRLGPDAPEAGWMAPVVPPAGTPGGLMILTDMPEEGDADAGELMSGRSGRLLDAMLAAIGESRAGVYRASLATARPVTGTIAGADAARLARLARHHVSLVAPQRLLLIGSATKRVFDTTNGSEFGNAGCDINQPGGNMEVVAIDALRFLLEQPSAKATAWNRILPFYRGTSL
ncbi:uracil-DNA glycosylase family protein [Sphingomonas canadensis]|nr:uracil-DNA glycosylase family protein [Sphingomonas canadensis]